MSANTAKFSLATLSLLKTQSSLARTNDCASGQWDRLRPAAVDPPAGEMTHFGAPRSPAMVPARLVAERDRRLYFLDPRTIESVTAHGNYVQLNRGADTYIARSTVKHLANVLAPFGFIAVRRGTLINVTAIDYADRLGGGEYRFHLRSGSIVLSSASHARDIHRVMAFGRSAGLPSP